MNYRKYKKAQPKSKKQGAKKKYNKPQKSLVHNKTQAVFGLGLPKQAVVTHKYHTFFQITSTAGTTGNQQYACNGLYDPDITGSGHQPLYYDSLSSIYDHYTVIGSKITYRISHNSTANGPMVCNFFINDDNTITPGNDAAAEQSSSKSLVIPTGSNNVFTKVMKWSSKKYFKGSVLNNYLMRGDTTSNPAESSLFTMTAYQPLGGSATLDVEVNIEYIAIWNELKDITGS